VLETGPGRNVARAGVSPPAPHTHTHTCAHTRNTITSATTTTTPPARWPAELYDRPILIFNSEDYIARGSLEPRGIHFSGELPDEVLDHVTPIRLSYHGHSHYNSVVPTTPQRPGENEEATDAVVPPLLPRGTNLIR
jgi:hypothetical protein